MTNRERKNEARLRERVLKVGEPRDPEFRVAAYKKGLQIRPLGFVQREVTRLYRDAAQCNRQLHAYSIAHEGKMPLMSSDVAGEVPVLGEKFLALGGELARRRSPVLGDVPLGGQYFQEFFKEVAAHVESQQATEKGLATQKTLLGRVAKWVRTSF